MFTARRAGLLLLTMIAAAVPLAGCGSGGAGGSAGSVAPPPAAAPVDVVRQSYARTVAAGSARATFQADTQAQGQRITVNGGGALDFAHQGYDVSFTGPGMTQPVRAVGMGVRTFLQLGTLSSQIPDAKPWLLLDRDRLRQSASPAAQQFLQGSPDPLGQLALVQGAGPDTRAVGPDTVDGSPTTHYASTLNLDEAVRDASDPGIQEAVRSYEQKAGPTVPAQVWTDDQGRLRKLLLSGVGPASGQPPTDVTLMFARFGEPVSITPPPADQTSDLADLLARSGR